MGVLDIMVWCIDGVNMWCLVLVFVCYVDVVWCCVVVNVMCVLLCGCIVVFAVFVDGCLVLVFFVC